MVDDLNLHTQDKLPDFTKPEFLIQHIESILGFYEPRVIDPKGGFYHYFLDDGTVYNAKDRHLVSSARFPINYAWAYRLTKKPHYQAWCLHGLEYLATAHKIGVKGQYAWEVTEDNGKDRKIKDGNCYAYGHAFVLLAAATAISHANLPQAITLLEDVYGFLENYFWQEEYSAYADERNQSLDVLSPYRGQNANMHMVEALIACYKATKNIKYLNRASLIARRFTVELTHQTNGQIWEHYDADWQLDLTYNIDKPDDLFKPWGFQTGHQIEWAKLLLTLDEIAPDPAWLGIAKQLYQSAMDKGWDKRYGGLVYGYGLKGEFADDRKYFWVLAEAIATAMRLYQRTKDKPYLEDYQRLWQWSWAHLIDHQYGAWYRVVATDGSWFEPYKSPAGKADYHTIGACLECLELVTHK